MSKNADQEERTCYWQRSKDTKAKCNVRNFICKLIEDNGILRSKSINWLTSGRTGIGITAVKKISDTDIETYNTPIKKKVNEDKMEFGKIDNFMRDLLYRTVYELYAKGISHEETSRSDYEFPCIQFPQ
mgnify:CR=1 FL=1